MYSTSLSSVCTLVSVLDSLETFRRRLLFIFCIFFMCHIGWSFYMNFFAFFSSAAFQVFYSFSSLSLSFSTSCFLYGDDVISATDPDQDDEYDKLGLEGTGEMSDGFIMPKSWHYKGVPRVEHQKALKYHQNLVQLKIFPNYYKREIYNCQKHVCWMGIALSFWMSTLRLS